MSDLKNNLKNVPYIKQFFSEYLDLRKDKDNEALIVESIRNGVEFKGTNLWILIFANFYSFIGLEREFYGSYYWCHADISADGTDNGSRVSYWTE